MELESQEGVAQESNTPEQKARSDEACTSTALQRWPSVCHRRSAASVAVAMSAHEDLLCSVHVLTPVVGASLQRTLTCSLPYLLP